MTTQKRSPMQHADDRSTLDVLQDTAAAFLRLTQALGEAEAVQWDPAARRPQARDDTTERSKGGHGDPTADVALDERRLALRDAVEEARLRLQIAATGVSAADRHLREALDAWAGRHAAD